jgi:hypothetical protein
MPSSKSSRARETVTTHHLRLEDVRKHAGLIEYLSGVFNSVVEEGMTYPQEFTTTTTQFESYFLGGDLLLGLCGDWRVNADESSPSQAIQSASDGQLAIPDHLHPSEGVAPDWSKVVAGFYYVSEWPQYIPC